MARVRAYRPDGPDGPEFDVGFVLHGSAADGTAGPAATWAQNCARAGIPENDVMFCGYRKAR
ncbi:hypothetical protein [Amycolatopsis sp. cmx-8-4]|uniref:hypothetical protein n=1 Tax=Amycolatopsis sp. cmx-8-4 TaxID=2790947 RepID=UPI00397D8EBB